MILLRLIRPRSRGLCLPEDWHRISALEHLVEKKTMPRVPTQAATFQPIDFLLVKTLWRILKIYFVLSTDHFKPDILVQSTYNMPWSRSFRWKSPTWPPTGNRP